MNIPDETIEYVGSAPADEARMQANALRDPTGQAPPIAIIVANERAVQEWGTAMEVAAKRAEDLGDRQTAEALRSGMATINTAMRGPLPLTGPLQ